MRSRASIKSHPIHPILISFPIAFFTGTFIADIISVVSDQINLAGTVRYLNIAAIGFALLAAVPGIIDYIYTVPPKSSAKKRATSHALLNVTTILLFTLVYFKRDEFSTQVIIGIEALAMITLGIAGWHGGTLVYRNQIGVDPRYADAGKWKEEYINGETMPVKVASSGELKLNQMKLVHVNGKRIVIARAEHGYVAFDDRCPHKGGSLAGGSMICGTVQCPWHGSQFSVETGIVKAGPSKDAISCYRIEEANGNLMLHDSLVQPLSIH